MLTVRISDKASYILNKSEHVQEGQGPVRVVGGGGRQYPVQGDRARIRAMYDGNLLWTHTRTETNKHTHTHL